MIRKLLVSESLCRQNISRHLPQYGAVFMASNLTRKECFERELFGLPYEYADFVMGVKTGMLLFLFDFQEKNLYGVFEASTDGGMNIVPDAYKSTSNRKFPAQVRFSTFWHCDPLPEHVFRDAIKENYFRQSKFSLGLSRDQVGRLLFLFEKRMLKIPSSPVKERQLQRSSQVEKSVVVTHPSSPVREIHQRNSGIENSVVVARPISVENSESFAESMQESIPENLGNLDASDHGTNGDLEDYIPLPSVEPEEIEDPPHGFLWDADLSALLSFSKVGGTDDEKHIESDTGYHVQGLDSDNLKPASCSSVPYRSIIAQVDHKKIDDSGDLQVRGLYSDKKKTSAFLRLSGLGKVLKEERHCQNKGTNLEEILKGLDERGKTMWKCKRIENDSNPRTSVFSRLKFNPGKAMESQRTLDVAKEFIRETLKRKSSSSLMTDEKDNENLPGKFCGGRLRRSRKRSRTSSLSSNVPDQSEESSVCSISH
ncbi:hypothetical protein SOVF_088780 [Spinacia oleracea]|nr:hypothetical protein SOVF_088780 [Spinacia oleracea]